MSVLGTIAGGAGRAVASPRLVLLLWLANVVVAIPAAVLVGGALQDSFGESLVAERMRTGFDADWHVEFEAGAEGLAGTFSPTVEGAGTVLDALEAWWSGRLFTEHPEIVALGAVYGLLWSFLAGGTLAHVARSWGRFDAVDFAASGGRCFRRFVGLAILSAGPYALVYLLGRRLYRLVEETTRDVTSERDVLLRVLVAVVVVVVLLHLVRMVFDYARIAAVLDPDRGVFRSAWAGLRTVARSPFRTTAVYATFGAAALALTAGYALLAPGAGQSTWPAVVLAFSLSQAYLLLRMATRVAQLGAEVRFYRASRPGSGAGA